MQVIKNHLRHVCLPFAATEFLEKYGICSFGGNLNKKVLEKKCFTEVMWLVTWAVSFTSRTQSMPLPL